MTDAPAGWDATLLDAFQRLPQIGFLAANLVDDPCDVASYVMHHHRPHEYTRVEENGIVLLKGPVGGGCALTSRELHDRVGGFQQSKGQVFWLEDQAYIRDINRIGFEAAFLEGLRVHHTGGPYYAPHSPERTATGARCGPRSSAGCWSSGRYTVCRSWPGRTGATAGSSRPTARSWSTARSTRLPPRRSRRAGPRA